MNSTSHRSKNFLLQFEGSQFWSGDLGLTLITISLALFIFVIVPLQEEGLPARFVLGLILLVLMASGVLSFGRKHVDTLFAILVLTLALIALWVSLVHPTIFFQRLSSVLSTAAFLAYVRIVLLIMFRDGPVTWSRIQGGVAAYLLIGLAWASAYQLIEQLHSGSFHFVSVPANVEQLSAKLVYFSFATLTTVGFGDVLAVEPFARSLAIAEAVIGQLFPAILIGALVAMAMQARPKT